MLVTGIERSCLGAAARDTERKAYSEELSSQDQDRGVMKGMGSGCLVMSTAAAAAAAVPSNSSSDYSLQL